MKTVYITKYALTHGIGSGVIAKEFGSGCIDCKTAGYRVYCKRGEWHENLESAQNKAEQMRVKKIASLEKQIEKLKALEF